jgi:putative flippase GtrA
VRKRKSLDGMKIDWTFPKWMAWTTLVIATIAAYPLARFASAEILLAALVGAGISICNAFAGYLAVEYAFDRSYTTFLKVVLGGMGIRLACMLGIMLGLILLFHMHAVALTFAILGLYLPFLVLEILYLQRKVLVSKQG